MSTVTEWQTARQDKHGKYELEHLGGVGWFDAPVPRRWHKCRPQTRGLFDYFTRVYRCACGAISGDAVHWSDRNSRKAGR